MDTFDVYSPKFDNPMRIKKERIIPSNGMQSYIFGFIKFDSSSSSAVVRDDKIMRIFISFFISFFITFFFTPLINIDISQLKGIVDKQISEVNIQNQ